MLLPKPQLEFYRLCYEWLDHPNTPKVVREISKLIPDAKHLCHVLHYARGVNEIFAQLSRTPDLSVPDKGKLYGLVKRYVEGNKG